MVWMPGWRSSRWWKGAEAKGAVICMMMDGREAVTAVLRSIGMELMAARPRTAPRLRSHRVRKAGGPAEMNWAEPGRRASFMAAGPPMLG